MSQKQYLKILEKEIQKINKKIDFKIMRGEDYRREAHDHRLMLRRLRYHTHRSFLSKFLPSVFQF